MVRNKKFALIFRVASLIFAISGLLANCITPEGKFSFSSFRFYTIQSNFLAVILFAILTYKTIVSLKSKDEDVGFFPRFEMVCVVDLLLTLIVYWVLLAPGAFNMGYAVYLLSFNNLSVHLVTPLLCLADYILFAKRGQLKYSDAYKVIIYPLLYVAFSTVAGFMGHVFSTSETDGLPVRFPYPFLDYDRKGVIYVLITIVVLVILFLIISHIFYFVDKIVGKRKVK